MADRIELQMSHLPWMPPRAEQLTVLHWYDMPLAGIVVQHGTSYFFWCIKGEVTQASLWGYTPVSDQERHELEGEPRDQIVRRLFSKSRPATVAFGVEGQGIAKWTDIEADTPEDIESRSLEFLKLAEDERELLETV